MVIWIGAEAMARRRTYSLAALAYDRAGLEPHELELLEGVLSRARRAVLDYPPDSVMSRAAAETLAKWGEPAPRKRGVGGSYESRDCRI